MRILLDTCIWGKAHLELDSAGHDVIWVGSWENDPGDDIILARANNEQRILVTLDKDFGELAVLRGIEHSGIIRLVNVSARKQASACLQVLQLYGQELLLGAIVTVEPDRIRIRHKDA